MENNGKIETFSTTSDNIVIDGSKLWGEISQPSVVSMNPIDSDIKPLITISLEEYKELLEYKGRYLEMKECGYYRPQPYYYPTITYGEGNKDWWKTTTTKKKPDNYHYTVTASVEEDENDRN